MEYIDGKDLYQMFNYGTYNILKERKQLNEINVFPVPDNDTGNNLASTMNAIKNRTVPDDDFQSVLDSISESALYGARGNSGVIFAQFCNGLRAASLGKSKVTIQEFVEMVNHSVDYVYKSILNPVEGTMLTVIRDWANSLIEIIKTNITNIKHVFEHAFQNAKISLEKTKEKLKILKKNNVVDSGAMGFVLFLKGINSYYNEELIDETAIEEVEIEAHDIHNEDVPFRYCTEGLVQANIEFDETELRETLKQYGDSLIIARGLNIFRIHIHTDNPELVFNELNKYGYIITQKVDNMKQDIRLSKSDRKQVIVTDSISDLPKDYIHENNVYQIPINIKINETEYLDKLSINNDILFGLIPKISEYPTTSMPAISLIETIYKRLLEHFDDLIVISVSSQLSGTYNSLKAAAEKIKIPNKKVVVIDSINNSVTQGLLVKAASDLINESVDTDKIVEEIEKLKQKTKILVCLKTVKYATMSGRLPKVVGKIGNLIGMRPIMSLDSLGKGTAFSIAFSKRGITKKIKKFVKKEFNEYGIKAYGIVHCLNPELATEYAKDFEEIIGFKPEYITEVSSATAIHSGIGTVAIGYIKEN